MALVHEDGRKAFGRSDQSDGFAVALPRLVCLYRDLARSREPRASHLDQRVSHRTSNGRIAVVVIGNTGIGNVRRRPPSRIAQVYRFQERAGNAAEVVTHIGIFSEREVPLPLGVNGLQKAYGLTGPPSQELLAEPCDKITQVEDELNTDRMLARALWAENDAGKAAVGTKHSHPDPMFGRAAPIKTSARSQELGPYGLAQLNTRFRTTETAERLNHRKIVTILDTVKKMSPPASPWNS